MNIKRWALHYKLEIPELLSHGLTANFYTLERSKAKQNAFTS